MDIGLLDEGDQQDGLAHLKINRGGSDDFAWLDGGIRLVPAVAMPVASAFLEQGMTDWVLELKDRCGT